MKRKREKEMKATPREAEEHLLASHMNGAHAIG